MTTSLTFLAGLVLGLVLAAGLTRLAASTRQAARRRRAAPPAPAVPPEQAAAPAAMPAAVPLELHGVLNGLSRLAVSAPQDEQLLEGVERLSDYLVSSTPTRGHATVGLPEVVEAYWNLHAWLGGRPCPIAWEGATATCRGGACQELAAQVCRALKDVDVASLRGLFIRILPDDALAGAGCAVELRCSLLAPDLARRFGDEWQPQPTGEMCRRLQVPAAPAQA